MIICVIDANVALKLFIEQPGSDLADALFSHLAGDSRTRFYVPEFFYAECASALANYVRLAGYTVEQAREAVNALLSLPFQAIPTKELTEDALNIALSHSVTGYDAFYVALSERINAPLVTADEKLVRAFANKPYSVQSLFTFKIHL